MAHLVHNAFYELAVFQAHKLFFDNIYWSYSFCRIVGVFYLDFNRHDIQIDKTRCLLPDRTISSPPSNAWQFASQRNQSTVITNAITDVIKRSTWNRSKIHVKDIINHHRFSPKPYPHQHNVDQFSKIKDQFYFIFERWRQAVYFLHKTIEVDSWAISS